MTDLKKLGFKTVFLCTIKQVKIYEITALQTFKNVYIKLLKHFFKTVIRMNINTI